MLSASTGYRNTDTNRSLTVHSANNRRVIPTIELDTRLLSDGCWWTSFSELQLETPITSVLNHAGDLDLGKQYAFNVQNRVEKVVL